MSLRTTVEALGPDLSPAMMQGTQAYLAARHPGFPPELRIERDFAYGEHERHRLDIFRNDGTEAAPVLVFVHGGGFVMGDKRAPGGLPFYDNVGAFAAQHGMVGVTITYRLAPAHPWPAGPEDMGAVVRWLQDDIVGFGGDPGRIFLMGQSAGASHVAAYVAHAAHHAGPGAAIAGAIMISLIHDVVSADDSPMHRAYFGEDRARHAAASDTTGLIAATVPQLFSVSEFDPAQFQKQAASLVAAWAAATGAYPRMHYLAGHNHLSPALAIGGPDDVLGPIITDFIADTLP